MWNWFKKLDVSDKPEPISECSFTYTTEPLTTELVHTITHDEEFIQPPHDLKANIYTGTIAYLTDWFNKDPDLFKPCTFSLVTAFPEYPVDHWDPNNPELCRTISGYCIETEESKIQFGSFYNLCKYNYVIQFVEGDEEVLLQLIDDKYYCSQLQTYPITTIRDFLAIIKNRESTLELRKYQKVAQQFLGEFDGTILK